MNDLDSNEGGNSAASKKNDTGISVGFDDEKTLLFMFSTFYGQTFLRFSLT